MTDDAFIPFAVPDISEPEIERVVAALRSGWVSSGPRVRDFEAAFGKYLGGGVTCVSVNSATAGLHLALEAQGIGPGDEVVVPTWTFTATAEVVRYLGAQPVFVDVDAGTLNMDPAAVKAAIGPRTRAVIPVHFAGLPVAMEEIDEIARSHDLAVIEDAAHALPAARSGVTVGTGSSAVTVFSFYATKNLTTGEGGMIVTRDLDVAERCRVMRLHGMSRDAFDRYRSRVPAWSYSVVAPGYKYNMTDPAAALGLGQLERLDDFAARRADIARRYDESMHGLPLDLPAHATEGSQHAWHLYVVRLTQAAPVSRENFIEEMGRLGVGCSVHFIPLHLQPYWRESQRLLADDFPVATREFSRVVSLPLYPSMTDAQVDRVAACVRQALQS